MSRQNKVNPGHYTRAGRLDPDELGLERRRQGGTPARRRAAKTPPVWQTTAPAVKPPATASPGRLKVAAARTVIGATRATTTAVKAVTGAARRALGTPSSRPERRARAKT